MSSSCVLQRCSSRSSGPSNSGSVTWYAVPLGVAAQLATSRTSPIAQASARRIAGRHDDPQAGQLERRRNEQDQQNQRAIALVPLDERVHRARQQSRQHGRAVQRPERQQVEEHQHHVQAQAEAQDPPSNVDRRACLARDDERRPKPASPAAGSSSAPPAPPACCRCASTACACSCSGWSSPACPTRSAGRRPSAPPPAAARWSPADRCATAATASAAPACAADGRPACRRQEACPNSCTDTAATNAIK